MRTNLEIYTFWHHFLVNEMARFVQNNTVSFTAHKKKTTQNDAVLSGTIHLLLPLDVL
jgi:hypothetical protein